mgnify:CR=1 FL=1
MKKIFVIEQIVKEQYKVEANNEEEATSKLQDMTAEPFLQEGISLRILETITE